MSTEEFQPEEIQPYEIFIFLSTEEFQPEEIQPEEFHPGGISTEEIQPEEFQPEEYPPSRNLKCTVYDPENFSLFYTLLLLYIQYTNKFEIKNR